MPVVTNLELGGGGINAQNTFSTPHNVSSTIPIPNDKDQLVYVTGASTWATRTPAASNNWRSVCWSAERGLFVAVSSTGTGNRVMTSPDGIAWTSRASSANDDWVSICWSPELGLFVAVANGPTSGSVSRIMSSPDGINWTSRLSTIMNNWWSVCWSPERRLFVVVGIGPTNNAMTSPDGINWTMQSPPLGNWRSVCWSAERGLFVAVQNTATNAAMTSPDGVTWTLRSSPSNARPTSICWSPEVGRFVATGDEIVDLAIGPQNYSMNSTDGITWSLGGGNPPGFGAPSICWSPERKIFLGISAIDSNVFHSSDGINFTNVADGMTISWNCVCWSPELGRFISLGDSQARSLDLAQFNRFNPKLIQDGQREGQRLTIVGTSGYNCPEVKNYTSETSRIESLKNSNDKALAVPPQKRFDFRWDSVNLMWVRIRGKTRKGYK